MNAMRTIGLVVLIASCAVTVIAQNASTQHSATETATKKEQFELGLKMIDGYRADLQDRLEKSTALLIIVIGWLITSDTARKSISSNSLLFWGGVTILTVLMGMYCLTISNFIEHFRTIQNNVEGLGYVDKSYLIRYKMPDRLFLAPISLAYITPILALYVFILLILFQIKYRFIPLPKVTDGEKEES